MAETKTPPRALGPALDITDEVAEGTYANIANIVYSPVEFVLDFARSVPGRTALKVLSRIILSPVLAKQFSLNLGESLARFEAQFGEIRLPHRAAPEGAPGFKQ